MKRIPVPNPFAKQFFHSYLVDHFLQKQHVLYNVIQKYASLKSEVLEGWTDTDDQQFMKSLRLEIRATYFQAIEALFELIFSLEPRGNVIDDKNMWYFLTTSNWKKHFKQIGKIAAGDTAFLDRTVVAGKNLEMPYWRYLFFFVINEPSRHKEINASYGPIKKFLVAFAKEFSQRDEYNAYKHALRILPALQKLETISPGSKNPIFSVDLSDYLSFLIEEDEGHIS